MPILVAKQPAEHGQQKPVSIIDYVDNNKKANKKQNESPIIGVVPNGNRNVF